MKTLLPFIAAATLITAGAVAQQPSTPPQGNSQQNGQGRNAQQQNAQPITPQQFVQGVETSNRYEIQAAQIAVRKTQDRSIRRFAELMVRDHSRIETGLQETIAADRNIDLPAYAPLTSQQTQLIDALNSATGTDFNNTYVQQAVDTHREALQLVDNYARNGSNARLKTFARRTAPIVRAHLLMAERLQKLVSQASPSTTTGRSSSGGRQGGGANPNPAPSSNRPAPANPASPSGGAGSTQMPSPAAPSGTSE